jgi:hypothetical protein
MIPVTLTLELKHLTDSNFSIPSNCACAKLFCELPGVDKAIVGKNTIILYGGDEACKIATPPELLYQEYKMWNDEDYEGYSFTIYAPPWVDPNKRVIQTEVKDVIDSILEWWRS